MRIGVDIRCLLTGQKSGIEQYTIKLLEYLLQLDYKNTYVLFYVSYRNIDEKMDQLVQEYPFLAKDNVEIKTLKWINFPLLLHALWKPLEWPKVDKICGGLDIMWLPSPRLLPVSSKCRLIITFHDLIFELFPQFYTRQSRLWQWQMNYPYLARMATNILTISKSTKNDLIKLYEISPEKIKIVYAGVDELYFRNPDIETTEQLRKKFKINDQFIYYIGSLEPRKNILSIIRSLHYFYESKALKSDKIKLVISGSKSWLTNTIFDEIKKLGLENKVIFTGTVSEVEKIAFLHMAQVFVFPTFYEGFGLPVLEAMAAGCPVITSNVSSLPEVTDGAAVLVDPNNQSEINLALEKVLLNAQFANLLATKGKLQAKKFSWTKTALTTLKVFNNGGI